MFPPCRPSRIRGAARAQLLDLYMAPVVAPVDPHDAYDIDDASRPPQPVRVKARDLPSFIDNHSLVVNMPHLQVNRISPEHIVMCRQSLRVTQVYSKLLEPRYSPIPASQRGFHNVVFDGRTRDREITVTRWHELFNRKVCDATGKPQDAYPLESLCSLLHAIQEEKPGVTEAFWSYIMMVALQYWLMANNRFVMYNDTNLASFSLGYPEFLFAICPLTDFVLSRRRVKASVSDDTLVWQLARVFTIPEFTMWLCTQVSTYCASRGYTCFCMKPAELLNEIDNKLHRNNELFLTSRRFSRVPYHDMGEYVDELNKAIREQCDELKIDVSSHTFGVCTKQWYPQQTQQRKSITKPNHPEFASSAVYFFTHPQFAPNLPILPSITGTSELELRSLSWWLQWWCPKSARQSIDPSFNHFVEHQKLAQASSASASASAATTISATSTSTSTSTSAASSDVMPPLPPDAQMLQPQNGHNSDSESTIVRSGSTQQMLEDTDSKSNTRNRKRKRGTQRQAHAYAQQLVGWDFVNYMRVQYSVIHAGGRGSLAYVIDKGKRDPSSVQELQRHEMSPMYLPVDALLSMVLSGDVPHHAIRTAKEWFEHAPADFRLLPRSSTSSPSPPPPQQPSSSAAASAAASTDQKQSLITDMLSVLESGTPKTTTSDLGVTVPAEEQRKTRHKSQAFPFDLATFGTKKPEVYTWKLHDTWSDKPASAYEAYMAFAFFHRAAKSHSTRWFNLWQALALISGDEAVAYRYTMYAWCSHGGGAFPKTAKSLHDNRAVCREFLYTLRSHYRIEVSMVHENYQRLLDRRRGLADRGCTPDLPKAENYEQVVRVLEQVINEPWSRAKRPRMMSAVSYGELMPVFGLETKNLQLQQAINHIPNDVSSHRWDRAFATWRSAGTATALVDHGDGRIEQQSVKEMLLHTLVRMWMDTWYWALSVQSMRRSPCLVPLDHMRSEGTHDALAMYRQRNRAAGWDRFITVSDASLRSGFEDDDHGARRLVDDVMADASANHGGGSSSNGGRVFVSEWRAMQDAAASSRHVLLQGMQNAVQRYLFSRAGKRALVAFVTQPPPLDAPAAELVYLAARILDPHGARSTTTSNASSSALPRLSTSASASASATTTSGSESTAAVLWRVHREFIQALFSGPLPIAADASEHPIVDAIDFVYSLLRRRLLAQPCVFEQDWTHADDVIHRAVFKSNAQDLVPSSTILIGRILQRILQDVAVSTLSTTTAIASTTSTNSAVAATASDPSVDVRITTSLLKSRLRESQNHKLAEHIFATFPSLIR